MSNSQRIYHSAFSILAQQCPTRRITQTRSLAWFITGLVVAANCQLTRIAPHLPWDGERDRVIQRLRRIVMNPRLEVRTLYGPTVGCLLQWLNGPDGLGLVIDRTALSHHLNCGLGGVAFRGRVLPLAWKVQKKQGSFQRRYVEAALRFIARWAPTHAQIWVVGDREYQDVALQTFVRDTLGWHFVQRLDHNTWVFPVRGKSFKLDASGLQPGDYHSFGRVRITQHRFGPVELLGYWTPGEDEPWYLISDRTLGRRAIRIYRKRFWIEEMFRDFKSHGWELEQSGLLDPTRMQRLLLCLAWAYVWLVNLGVQVVKRGQRVWVDRRQRRTLSYFRLGGNWLHRRLARHATLPPLTLAPSYAK